MESFATIVNAWKLVTIVAKLPVLQIVSKFSLEILNFAFNIKRINYLLSPEMSENIEGIEVTYLA